MAFDDKFMDWASLADIFGNPNELFRDQFYFWNGKADHHEWLKSDRHVVAILFWTSDCTFELAVHQIDDYGLGSL